MKLSFNPEDRIPAGLQRIELTARNDDEAGLLAKFVQVFHGIGGTIMVDSGGSATSMAVFDPKNN